MNISEAIDQVIMEDQAEAKNTTVDTFSPQRNKSESLINEVKNLTKNDVKNNLINNFANLKINDVGNNLINKVTNSTINNVGNDSNRVTASDV